MLRMQSHLKPMDVWIPFVMDFKCKNICPACNIFLQCIISSLNDFMTLDIKRNLKFSITPYRIICWGCIDIRLVTIHLKVQWSFYRLTHYSGHIVFFPSSNDEKIISLIKLSTLYYSLLFMFHFSFVSFHKNSKIILTMDDLLFIQMLINQISSNTDFTKIIL